MAGKPSPSSTRAHTPKAYATLLDHVLVFHLQSSQLTDPKNVGPCNCVCTRFSADAQRSANGASLMPLSRAPLIRSAATSASHAAVQPIVSDQVHSKHMVPKTPCNSQHMKTSTTHLRCSRHSRVPQPQNSNQTNARHAPTATLPHHPHAAASCWTQAPAYEQQLGCHCTAS